MCVLGFVVCVHGLVLLLLLHALGCVLSSPHPLVELSFAVYIVLLLH